MRSADDELAGGVDVVFDVVAKQCEHLVGVDLRLDTGNEDVDDVLADAGQHALVVAVELVVLGRDDDGIDALGDTGIAVLDGDLTFRVWSQVRHHLALLTDFRQCTHDEMGQVQ